MKKKILQKMYGSGDQPKDGFRDHLYRNLCMVFDHLSNSIQSTLGFLVDHLEEAGNLVQWAQAAGTNQEFLHRYRKAHGHSCRMLVSSCEIKTYMVKLILEDAYLEEEHSGYTQETNRTTNGPTTYKSSWKDELKRRMGKSLSKTVGSVSKGACGDARDSGEKVTSGASVSWKNSVDEKASNSLIEGHALDQNEQFGRKERTFGLSSVNLSSSISSELGGSTTISAPSGKSVSPRLSRSFVEDIQAASSNAEIQAVEKILNEKTTTKKSGWMEFYDRRDKSCRIKDTSNKISTEPEVIVSDILQFERLLAEKMLDLQGMTKSLSASKESLDKTIGTGIPTDSLENESFDNYGRHDNQSSMENDEIDGGECSWKIRHSSFVKSQEHDIGPDGNDLEVEYSSAGQSEDTARKNMLSNKIPVVKVPFGQPVEVVIAHIEDPMTVWLQKMDCRLEDFQTNLNEVMSDYKPLVKPPVIGDIVVATYSSDKAFYRARIVAIDERDVFTVLFLDYGNQDYVFLEDLRPLPECFWEYPCAGLRSLLLWVDEIPSGDSAALVKQLENWSIYNPIKAVFYQVADKTTADGRCLRVSLELVNGLNLADVYPDAFCKKSGKSTQDDSHESEGLGSFPSDSVNNSISNPPQPPVSMTLKLALPHISNGAKKWEPLSEEQMDQTHPKWFRPTSAHRPVVYVTDSSGAVWVQQRWEHRNIVPEEGEKTNTGSMSSSQEAAVENDEFPSLNNTVNINGQECPSLNDTTSSKKKRRKRKKKKKTEQTSGDVVNYSMDESEKRNDYEERSLSESSGVKAVDDTVMFKKSPYVFLESMPIPSIDTDIMVQIAYINSPTDFFVHLVPSDDSQIGSFQSNLQEFYEGLHEELPCIKLQCGTYWAARNEDGLWYRCKIIANKEEPNCVEVSLVDYGPVITVNAKDMRVLKEEFTHSPAFAVPCSLEKVYPVEGNIWTKETIDIFERFCGNKDETFIIQFLKKKPTGVYSVILKKFNGEPINEGLRAKGVASHKPEVQVNVQQETEQDESTEGLNQDWDPMAIEFLSKENDISSNKECAETAFVNRSNSDEKRLCKFYREGLLCPRGDSCKWEHTRKREGGITTEKQPVFCSLQYDLELPEEDTFVPIIVTSINSLSQFHVFMPHGPRCLYEQDSGTESGQEGESLKAFSQSLNDHYINMLPSFSQTATAPGELWVYRERNGRCWRVRVIEVDKDVNQVQVYYIDLGGTEWIEEESLLPMEIQFIHFPEQAIECYLTRVSEAVPEGNHEAFLERFLKLTEGKTLIALVVEIQENQRRLGLELFDGTTDPIYINEEILKMLNAS
ncbi:uncharacterized protein LOC143024902 [Oratosquilla oratoria]|uniref:uncharacterized protein LOC143024902 n=1 Tax=Oratosquilla oratoria TaxID=337810 RepID=UPI003F7632F6